jgi:hypothetical protein
MLHWSMIALVDIMQSNPLAFVLGDSESQAVRAPLSRHSGASMGVSQITEVFEFDLCWGNGFCSGTARPTETGTQRQTARERPADHEGLFLGEEKRACHDNLILVPMPKIV